MTVTQTVTVTVRVRMSVTVTVIYEFNRYSVCIYYNHRDIPVDNVVYITYALWYLYVTFYHVRIIEVVLLY